MKLYSNSNRKGRNMRLKNRLAVSGYIVAAALATGITSAAFSQTTFLYQGSGSTAPGSPWLFAFTSGATASSASGSTILDTTNSYALKVGYSNTFPIINTLVDSSFPSLNPTSGFTVGFDVQLNSESHTINQTVNSNRAGFDVIVLGDDAKGVELGFWDGDVWAQNADFTHGEDDAFDTESSLLHYDLTILGSSYTLSAGGSPILTGSTRDYSAEGAPYTLPNYIFIGDDTTEAEAKETFSTLSVTVPEPATMRGILALGAAMFARRRAR
jgi:hypothetical protein